MPDPFTSYFIRQAAWSKKTFGPGKRTRGILAHIRKEIAEVEADPSDLVEWIDIAILAMDGYWRHGGDPSRILTYFQDKQKINFSRIWPEPTSEDDPIEHVRSIDPQDPHTPKDKIRELI